MYICIDSLLLINVYKDSVITDMQKEVVSMQFILYLNVSSMILLSDSVIIIYNKFNNNYYNHEVNNIL